MPAVDQPVMNTIGYHIRTGKHDVTPFDWKCYLDFADRHFQRLYDHDLNSRSESRQDFRPIPGAAEALDELRYRSLSCDELLVHTSCFSNPLTSKHREKTNEC